MSKPKILAIIPARGGSKGIPNKNIRLFCGQPLIAYVIKQALSLKKKEVLDRVIVSTENPHIAAISKKYGAEIPFLRPKRFARDKSNITDAMLYTLNRLKKEEKYTPNYVMLLQPPSPLREETDILNCIKKINTPGTDAVLTVCPTHALFYNLTQDNELILVNKVNIKKSHNNRQEMPKGYKLNGCFVYLIKYDVLMKTKTFFPPRTKAVVCDAWRSIDLDDPEDWALAEAIFRNKNKIKQTIQKINLEKINK